MSTSPSEAVSKYRNAMETLAVEEIERQLQDLPIEVVNSINKADAIAYALNRLPPLYATTEEGARWQQERARKSLTDLISKAASWGIRAAGQNTKVFPTPLQPTEAEVALQKLRELLGREDLSWKNLVAVVAQTAIQSASNNWGSFYNSGIEKSGHDDNRRNRKAG